MGYVSQKLETMIQMLADLFHRVQATEEHQKQKAAFPIQPAHPPLILMEGVS